jgi:CHASE2 domain-containing sensor protein
MRSRQPRPSKPHLHRSPWLPNIWDLTLLTIILLSGFLLDDPGFKKQVPWLVSLQMGAHSLLSGWSPLGGSSPQAVSVVEIDDAAFWSAPLSGVQPTNRAYLADLVNAAVKAGPRVIGLDFQLKSPSSVPADDPVRVADDRKLIEAVAAAGQAHIPVVLTAGLVLEGDQWRREPNICDDRNRSALFYSEPGQNPLGKAVLPLAAAPCATLSQASTVSLGYINLPADRREVPLRFEAAEFDGSASKEFSSFALQLVSAYAARRDYEAQPGVPGPPSPGNGNPQALPAYYQEALTVANANDFAYAGFIPQEAFKKYAVPAGSLLAASGAAPAQWEASTERGQLAGRIVLIGATWHEWGQGRGPILDQYASPAGLMPGVYLHANYVEAILRGLAKPLSRVWARVIEVISGYLLIVLMHWRRRFAEWLLVWLGGSVLLAVLALLLSSLGWYLDFALVSLLLLAHVFVEHYEHLRRHAAQGGG